MINILESKTLTRASKAFGYLLETMPANKQRVAIRPAFHDNYGVPPALVICCRGANRKSSRTSRCSCNYLIAALPPALAYDTVSTDSAAILTSAGPCHILSFLTMLHTLAFVTHRQHHVSQCETPDKNIADSSGTSLLI